MPKFKINKEKIKKALNIVSLATQDKENHIYSHALFSINKNILQLNSTDQDRIAFTSVEIIPEDENSPQWSFTADPKKLLALIKSADSENITFDYNSESKTLNIQVSDIEGDSLSLASFNAEEFLTFESEIEKAFEKKTFNPGSLSSALRFLEGHLTTDQNKKKFLNIYLSNGILYSSNGTDKIGVYQIEDFEGVDYTAFRSDILSKLHTFLKADFDLMVLKETSKIVLITSLNGDSGFGFRRSLEKMPILPITLEEPDTDTYIVDKDLILKKLNRLSITSGSDTGIKFNVGSDTVVMETVSERKSTESLPCKRIKGMTKLQYVVSYKTIHSILSQFQASELPIYIDTNKKTIISKASLEIENEKKEKVLKPFTAISAMSLAKIV